MNPHELPQGTLWNASNLPPSSQTSDSSLRPDMIDPLLLSALRDPVHRSLILKLDLEVARFIKDRTPGYLAFPPMASFQRLIVHRVASYFRVSHTVTGNKGARRSVVLHKLPTSRIPVLRLSDLVPKEEPKIVRKILMKPRTTSESSDTVQSPAPQIMKVTKIATRPNPKNSNSTKSTIKILPRNPTPIDSPKTLEQRAEEYAKARAKLFDDDNTGIEDFERVKDPESFLATNTNSVPNPTTLLPAEQPISIPTANHISQASTNQANQTRIPQKQIPSQSAPSPFDAPFFSTMPVSQAKYNNMSWNQAQQVPMKDQTYSMQQYTNLAPQNAFSQQYHPGYTASPMNAISPPVINPNYSPFPTNTPYYQMAPQWGNPPPTPYYTAMTSSRPLLYSYNDLSPGCPVTPDTTTPPHILEIAFKPPVNVNALLSLRNYENTVLKQLGERGRFVAIFRSSSVAKEAMDANEANTFFKLIRWEGKTE